MSFTLRQIAQRAGGGDIVRTRSTDASELTIGRGTDCDIQLPDLAVSLRHARLRQLGPRRIAVEALGETTFEVNGSASKKAEFDLGAETKLTFGSHILTLVAGGQANEVVVTIVPGEALHETADTGASNAGFSLAAVLFSRRRAAWLALLVILALCLALPISGFFLPGLQAKIRADQQWSSGPLSQVHAFLEHDCQSCHQQAFVAVRDRACLACHGQGQGKVSFQHLTANLREAGSFFPPKPIIGHAAPGRLLKAKSVPVDMIGKIEVLIERTLNHPDDRCATCHKEHVSQKASASGLETHAGGILPVSATMPVTVPALTMAETCTGCHGGLKQRLSDTTLHDTPDWGHHPDFRPLVTLSPEGAHLRVERIALSNRPQENSGLIFSHKVHVSATGGVARLAQTLGPAQGYGAPLACANCHRSDPAGRGFVPIEMKRDCAACHSLAFARNGTELETLPHGEPERVVTMLRDYYASGRARAADTGELFRRRPGFADAAQATVSPDATSMIRAVFSQGGICYGCHSIVVPKDPRLLAFAIAPVHLAARYLPAGGFDHSLLQHQKDAQGRLICGTCHQADMSDRATDVMLPNISECATCHGKTKAQTPMAASGDCTDCHGYHDTAKPGRGPLVLFSDLPEAGPPAR